MILFLMALALQAPASAPRDCRRTAGAAETRGPYCLVVAAEGLGPARHLAVTEGGDVLVGIRGGEGGGVLVLEGPDSTGRYRSRGRFGPSLVTGLALTGRSIFVATQSEVLRYRWNPVARWPAEGVDTVVHELPVFGEHNDKSVAVGPGGALYVGLGSPSNSCQLENRQPRSPGRDPCPELADRAGIWRFDAWGRNQRQADGVRYATGLRNPSALAVEPLTGALHAAVNGRDELASDWGFGSRDADLPAEELFRVEPGADHGWPYCYFDPLGGRKVLAPEYGGDGVMVGRCATAAAPLIAFAAHQVPIAMAFAHLGADTGLLIAFRGRRPNATSQRVRDRVDFVRFADGHPAGDPRTILLPRFGAGGLRPTGVAVDRAGAVLVVSQDLGTLWRLLPVGSRDP
jgi:glucose/arabinose dehydrogenase